MLERDGVLMTWRLSELPAASAPIAATRLDDHRIDYLDYEGPISGDRGEVRRVDAGEYLLIDESADELLVDLYGATVHWRGVLPRTAIG